MSDKENTFELSDLFTTERINEGAWFAPSASGVFCGLRFKVLGVGSTKVIDAFAKYTNAVDSIPVDKGIEVAVNTQASVNAEFASNIVADVETLDGRKIVFQGKEISNIQETMKKLFEGNPLIAEKIIEFASNDFNYMNIN